MTLPSFGIPQQAAIAHGLQELIDANWHALQELSEAAMQPVVEAIAGNHKELGSVQQRAKRYLSQVANANSTELESVADTFAGHFGGGIAANQSLLGQMPGLSTPDRQRHIIMPEDTTPPERQSGEPPQYSPPPQTTWDVWHTDVVGPTCYITGPGGFALHPGDQLLSTWPTVAEAVDYLENSPACHP